MALFPLSKSIISSMLSIMLGAKEEEDGPFLIELPSWGAKTHKTVNIIMWKCQSVSHSVVSNFFVTPQTIAHQAPLSTEFSRHEYWSGLPFPPPEYLPDPGTEPTFLMSPEPEGKFSSASTSWEAQMTQQYLLNKMSLNGSTHKNKVMYWLAEKMLWPRESQEPTPTTPARAVVQD